MAGAFDAKVDISTAEASAALTALRKEVKDTGAALLELDKIIKASNGSLSEIATQFTALVAAQRAAASATKETAQADIAAARAAGIRNVADAKVEETLARKAMLEAQATKATEAANLSAERGFSVSQKRIQGDVDRAAAAEKAAAAADKVTTAEERMQGSLANSRYLMYDVAATYGIMSAGLLAIPAATAAVAAAYQKDFAQVLRITDQTTAQAASLQQGLKDLGTSIPMSFKDMTDIAQMGAHLQLGNEGLVQFTETVAKFSATTGVAADTSAAMFSKMKTMFSQDATAAGPGYFNLLGSSIAEMGTKIVATDQQVTAMVTSIQAATSTAGMSTQATVGLAGAMASLSIQPEMARGALTRLFATFNRDSADATGKMQKFGDVIGMSGTQAAALWKNDPNKFFTELIAGLNQTYKAGGNLTTVLDTLGIKNVRDINTLQRLAVGYDVLGKAQAGASDGYAKGTALDKLSAPVFETLAAKITELVNAWKNLGDTVGAGILAPIGAVVEVLKEVAVVTDTLIHQFPLLGSGIQILLGIATVTGMFMAFKGAQALVMAAMLGFRESAAKGLGTGLSLSNMAKTLAQTMLMAKGATEEQTKALLDQAGALRALTIASGTSKAAIEAGIETPMTRATSATGSLTGGLKTVGSSLLTMVGGPIGLAIGALGLLVGALIQTKTEADSAGKAIGEAMAQGSSDLLHTAADQLTKVKVNPIDTVAFSLWGKNLRELADESGISFDKLAAAAAKGKGAVAAITPEFDKVAKSKGFKDFQDFYDHGGTDVAGLSVLKKKLEEVAGATDSAAKDAKAITQVAPEAGAAMADMGDGADTGTTAIDKMDKALKALNDTAFGTINAQSDLQDALVKIGEGMHAGNSFNVNNETGRTNIKNVQDALTKARDYYKNLMDTQQMTAQQAAQGYTDFTAKLMGDIRTKFGANTSYIDSMAQQTTTLFKDAIGGAPVTVPVKTDPAQVQAAATQTAGTIQQKFGNLKAELTVGMNPADAEQKINQLVIDLARITGLPQMVIVDALTNPASEKAAYIKGVLKSIENHTYVAPVNANTDPAIKNVQNFQTYAQSVLASIQNSFNQVAASSPTLAKFVKPMFKGVTGVAAPAGIARPSSQVSVPTTAVPAQVGVDNAAAAAAQKAADDALAPSLDNVANGYKSAADAAAKSGPAVKGAAAAAKEAAKDYASGISEAVQQAVDYGNRLKTALMSAYDQQYALTTATDDYHSALNAIQKKRDDEIKQVSDLKDKIKQLNDERAKELITANKAKIEQGISIKYGEGARAADYGNQAQTALDNAAAKQKEIDASSKEADTIQAGIGLLTGYSDAAIANRAALRGLETKMIDMVAAYATLGHSTDEVRQFAANLTGQYKIDVGQIGFNQTAVQNLTGDFGRYIDTINRVPRVVPTQVDANTDAAQKQFDDLNGALDQVEVPRTATVDLSIGQEFQDFLDKKGKYATLNDINGDTFRPGNSLKVPGLTGGYTGGSIGSLMGFNSGGLIPGTRPADPRSDNMLAQVDGKGLIKVQSTEFIQPSEAVSYYGLDFMEAIRTMSLPKFNAGGSPSGSRGSASAAGQAVVDLGAETLAALAEMRQEIKLFADSRELASSVNAGNRQLAAEGHRS